jgi:hypothetical protein
MYMKSLKVFSALLIACVVGIFPLQAKDKDKDKDKDHDKKHHDDHDRGPKFTFRFTTPEPFPSGRRYYYVEPRCEFVLRPAPVTSPVYGYDRYGNRYVRGYERPYWHWCVVHGSWDCYNP